MADRQRIHELDLDLELEALKVNLLAEDNPYNISQKQVQALASVIGQGLQNRKRENRLDVLRLLAQDAVTIRTGYKIESTKLIPGAFASVLLDMLIVNNIDWELSDYGRELLFLAEERVKARVVSQKN